jgi:CRP-like cAMP-binding protein
MDHVRNRLLAALPPDILGELAPRLRPVQFLPEHALYRAGERVAHVYFPGSGLISHVVAVDHHRVETAMVGHDSVVGVAAALADPVALSTALVQAAGQGHALEAAVLRAAAERHPPLRATLLRHQEAVLAQAQQTAVCNVAHTIEQRLARWLLRAHDMSGRASLELTQEFLADRLGVRRASVSQAAHMLQEAGLIGYRRGQIHLRDVEGLRQAACECYRVVKRHYDRLVKPEPAAL